MEKKLIIVGTGQWAKDLKAFVDRDGLFNVVGYAVEKEYLQSVEIGGHQSVRWRSWSGTLISPPSMYLRLYLAFII